jgi:hypothetical protein
VTFNLFSSPSEHEVKRFVHSRHYCTANSGKKVHRNKEVWDFSSKRVPAMAALAKRTMYEFFEWQQGQADVCQFLGWSDGDIADQVNALHECFDQAA